jgi:hypothetical protein
MGKSILLWVIAFVLMSGLAIYQRMTGPTYPKRGDYTVNGTTVKYKFIRTHVDRENAEINFRIKDGNEDINAKLKYRRFKSYDSWHEVPMDKGTDKKGRTVYSAEIPKQPAAGKVQYEVLIDDGEGHWVPVVTEPVIIRFKGHVPEFVLYPHIFFMFLSMVTAMRALIEVLFKRDRAYLFGIITLVSFAIGGLILGPVVQKYAFDAYWTGWPFGTDLTDNKTLASVVMWVIAIWRVKKNPKQQWWIIIAVIVQLAIYLIPHSLLGSEIDYTKLEDAKQAVL